MLRARLSGAQGNGLMQGGIAPSGIIKDGMAANLLR
jgi:hypothetical protein